MPRKCCVPECRSNYNDKIACTTVFRFPKDLNLREKWIRSINRENFEPISSSVVCIKHFCEKYLIREEKITRYDGSQFFQLRKPIVLSEDAYPSLFLNQPKYISREPTKKRKATDDMECEAMLPKNEKKIKIWCEEDNILSFESFTKLFEKKTLDSWVVIKNENYILFCQIEHANQPMITVSFKIFKDLSIKVWHYQTTLMITDFECILGSTLKCDKWTKFENLLSNLKSYSSIYSTRSSKEKLKQTETAYLLEQCIALPDVIPDEIKFEHIEYKDKTLKLEKEQCQPSTPSSEPTLESIKFEHIEYKDKTLKLKKKQCQPSTPSSEPTLESIKFEDIEVKDETLELGPESCQPSVPIIEPTLESIKFEDIEFKDETLELEKEQCQPSAPSSEPTLESIKFEDIELKDETLESETCQPSTPSSEATLESISSESTEKKLETIDSASLFDKLSSDDGGRMEEKKALSLSSDADNNRMNDNLEQSTVPPLETEHSRPAIYVRLSLNTNEKRNWGKKQFCIYCLADPNSEIESYCNLAKHLLLKHEKEVDILKISSLPLGSQERKRLLELLRNRGNYAHNIDVLKRGRGEIIPWRSPPSFTCYTKFEPCKNCFGFFQIKDLWKHKKKCLPINNEHKSSMKFSDFMLPPPKVETEILNKDIFNRMIQDNITLAVRNDDIINRLTRKLYHKHCESENCQTYISQKLREIGRLLLSIRQKDETLTCMEKILNQSYFKVIVESTWEISGYNHEKGSFKTPSLAWKIGHTLSKCAKIKEGLALEYHNAKMKEEAMEFARSMELDWTDLISHKALKNMESSKLNNPTILPLTEDIKLLQSYLKSETNKCEVALSSTPNNAHWIRLCRLALTSLMLFNRKRTGEASKILLKEYLEKSIGTSSSDVEESLTPIEKSICQHFARIEIREKTGKKAPVIFYPALVKTIDLLVKMRDIVGVNPNNKYLFAYSFENATTHVRGHDCLRYFVNECGAVNKANITGTNLRNHIATYSQILNLEENELEQLATFMGHKVVLYINFYNLPVDTYQLAKVAKLLISLDSGTFSQYKGKSLDEIEIDLDEQVQEEENVIQLDNSNVEETLEGLANPESLNSNTCEVLTKNIKNSNPATNNVYEERNENSQVVQCLKPKLVKRKQSYSDEDSEHESSNEITKTRKRSKYVRINWSTEEKRRVYDYFINTYKLGKLPGKSEILQFISENGMMTKYPWEKIKQTCRRQLTAYNNSKTI